MKHNKLHIFYRHYDTENPSKSNVAGNGRIPSWFSFEKCFLSLFNSIKDRDDVCLHIIMDSLEPKNNFIYKYKDFLTIYTIDTSSCVNDHLDLARNIQKIQPNRQHSATTVLTTDNYPLPRDFISLRETLKYIKTLRVDPDDKIFICENDYLFQNNWLDKINLLYEEFPDLTSNNYIAPCDARYRYKHLRGDNLKGPITDINRFEKFNFFSTGTQSVDDWNQGFMPDGSHHWMVIQPGGTPHAMSTKKIFDEDYDIVYQTILDSAVWPKLYHERERLLISPIPGLSCHIMNRQLSPGADWKTISEQTKLDL